MSERSAFIKKELKKRNKALAKKKQEQQRKNRALTITIVSLSALINLGVFAYSFPQVFYMAVAIHLGLAMLCVIGIFIYSTAIEDLPKGI